MTLILEEVQAFEPSIQLSLLEPVRIEQQVGWY